MSTSTISANFAQATRKVGDRSVTYTWRSPLQNIAFDGEQVGGLVKLDISHDSDRKQFSAFIRFAHYDRSRGFEVVKFAIFDNDNYPSGTVASQPIARYSAKALGEFENRVVNYLNEVRTRASGLVGRQILECWNRATLIATGGNGTEGQA